MIKKLSIIGAGLMGHGIATQAALIGKYQVTLCDINKECLDKGTKLISDWLKKAVSNNFTTEKEFKETLDRIGSTTDLKEAVRQADFIIEAITENKEVKKALLKEVGGIASKEVIIVTNTSSIRISELSEVMRYPENFAGMHFFNPPQIMQLVEVVKGERTSDSTIQSVLEVAHKMGKETVIVEKDCPGFIVNRIMMAALNEAVELYYSGIAEKEDIDRAIKLGLKWPMGPLQLIDQIGLDTVIAIDEVLGKEVDSKFLPHRELKEMKEKGMLGRKTGKGFYDWYKK
jgi:3-hydroxybutyryl-CoA dehydrogenase